MRAPAAADPGRRRRVRALALSGALLLAAGQVLTLVHVRPWSDGWYGVVWTGFILAADAVLAARTGASLALDRPRDLALMTLASAALWWLFEGANALLLASWHYSPSPDVPLWAQRLRSNWFFATLLPATWEATLLALLVSGRSISCTSSPSSPGGALPLASSSGSPPDSPARPARGLVAGALAAGVAVASLIVWWPGLSLPLGLIALGLIVDAVNLGRGRPSLLAHLRAGRWRLPLAISLGNIAAGFVGEMWNYPADPSWTYHASYAGELRVFAMPLPGYLGYAALALDLFALYHLVRPARPGDPLLPSDHPLALTGLG